uniref:Choline/carnitine acyltransferase domain-containing protein n=2 Tax=Ixodes scapularis TaxID=6945 RepID=A0A1S4LD39_IXOSC
MPSSQIVAAKPETPEGIMMSRQEELPILPVVPLQDMLRRYMDFVEPFLKGQEVEEFRKENLRLLCSKATVSHSKRKLQHLLSVDISYTRHCRVIFRGTADSQNAASLEAIKMAALVVCLDGGLADAGPYEVAWPRQVCKGGPNAEYGANRWWDKPVQVIVGEDGGSALLYDHTAFDGTVMARVTNHCYDY